MRLTLICLSLLATPLAAQERHDCIMDPSLVVEVGGAVDALMTEAFVSRGDDVTKGQLIARMDASVQAAILAHATELADSGSGVNIAQTRLDLARTEVERAEQLLTRNLLPQSAVEALRARAAEAELELQQAQIDQRLARLEKDRVAAQMAQYEIRSPLDGIVITRMVSPGEYVYSQAPVAQLAQNDPIHIEVFLPLSYYPSLQLGETGQIYPAAPIGGEYTAQIIAIDRVFDAASDTFGVRLALTNPAGALPTGLDCQVDFTTAVEN